MSDQIFAARVFFSLAEIRDLLKLAPGYTLELVAEARPHERPGLWLTISGPGLPPHNPDDPLPSITLPMFVKSVNDHLGGHDYEHGHIPAKPPVAESDSAKWPRFPGEGLDYRGAEQTDAPQPSKASVHTGGPR